ncbi:hypothetical protein, partial [Methanoregula sp.]|uniref:hypothetical protein n=1 Tax=Methanoregula sp. TaxID=2052170 RepID=UPI000CCA69C9
MKQYGLAIAAVAAVVLVVAVFAWGIPGSAGLQGRSDTSASLQVPALSPQPSATPAAEPVTRTYAYVLRGENGTVRLDLDPGLYNRLAAGAPPAVCTTPV